MIDDDVLIRYRQHFLNSDTPILDIRMIDDAT